MASQTSTSSTAGNLNRNERKAVAEDTLAAIERGSLSHLSFDIKTKVEYTNRNTVYFPPESELAAWSTTASASAPPAPALAPESGSTPCPPQTVTNVTLEEISTLVGARQLLERVSNRTFLEPQSRARVTIGDEDTTHAQGSGSPELEHTANETPPGSPSSPHPTPKVGILNFASAKNPGGGFLGGSGAQEESIARSSTLYPSLITPVAQAYYKNHKRDPKGGYYSHAMIFSPSVVVLKDDDGKWVGDPFEVDVLTSPAVNAGVVRRSNKVGDGDIESTMRERMARVLFLFEREGVRHIVLGSFGTGAFRNDVGMVARIWADLVLERGGRFERSFENVLFAVLGRETFLKFEEVFAERRGANVARVAT